MLSIFGSTTVRNQREAKIEWTSGGRPRNEGGIICRLGGSRGDNVSGRRPSVQRSGLLCSDPGRDRRRGRPSAQPSRGLRGKQQRLDRGTPQQAASTFHLARRTGPPSRRARRGGADNR